MIDINKIGPYTYLLIWTTFGLKYYGCQYNKSACPQNIISGKYKTSSKHVKNIWSIFGPPDQVIIHKQFDNVNDCRSFEHKFLKYNRVIYKPEWINKTDNISIDPKTYSDRSWKQSVKIRREKLINDDGLIKSRMREQCIKNMHNEECAIKRKETFKINKHSQGKNNPNYGKKHSDSTRQKISESRKSQTNLNHKKGIALNSKRFVCEFCGKTNLNSGNYKRYHGANCKLNFTSNL